jgi:hypothetical protein
MIIPKRDPTDLPQWVCNYQTLNSFMVKDWSPLPKVDKLIQTRDCPGASGYLAAFSAKSAIRSHWQVSSDTCPWNGRQGTSWKGVRILLWSFTVRRREF